MIDPAESRFADLVRRAAPPERDPLFRLQLLERQETARYRRQSQRTLAAVLAVLVCAAVAASLRPVGFDTLSLLMALGAAFIGYTLFGADLLGRLLNLRR